MHAVYIKIHISGKSYVRRAQTNLLPRMGLGGQVSENGGAGWGEAEQEWERGGGVYEGETTSATEKTTFSFCNFEILHNENCLRAEINRLFLIKFQGGK